MADTGNESDIADFLTNAAWAVCSTYNTILKTCERDILIDVPFLWSKILDHRQKQMDKNTVRENSCHIDWHYQPSDKVHMIKDGILCKSESQYESEPWTMSVNINCPRRIQSGYTSQE
jgi:hypothetical protein